jgi:thiamine-monophosphate kinase
VGTPNSETPGPGGDGSGPAADAAGPGRDEFALIDVLRTRFERAGTPVPGDVGIGDDAAAVTLPHGGRVVLATDLVVDGVHVDRALSSPEDIGWKALMVAVSDLAAMGVEAPFALLSVAAPEGFPVERLGDGVAEAADAAGCRVVGGDLSGSGVLVVSVTAIGAAGRDGPPLLGRSGARPGDHVLVTGPLGGSAAGRRVLTDPSGGAGWPDLARAHRRPVARLAEGVTARDSGAVAAVDVSDGLVADARHLAEASGVGIDLVLPDAGVTPGATRDEALGGGEDYELVLVTADPGRLLEAFAARGLRPLIGIGRCTDAAGAVRVDGVPVTDGGWRHRF